MPASKFLKKKGVAKIPLTLILTIVFVLLVIGLGPVILDGSGAMEGLNESIEFAKNITKTESKELLEFCAGENRRSPEPVPVSSLTKDFSGDGKIKCADIENLAVSCNVPGTHERGSGCLLESFERTQWVEDGCEDPADFVWRGFIPVNYIPRGNTGWYKFNFTDPELNDEYYGKNKKFIFPCGETIDKDDLQSWNPLWPLPPYLECYMDWLHHVDSYEEEQKYGIGIKLEPNEEIVVNSYFCDLWLAKTSTGDCAGSEIEEKCGNNPENDWVYCDGESYNMGEGSFSVNAHICCPPSGTVEGPNGHIVYDEGGNQVVENWYWDSERESCCLGMTCINKECEDEGGVWMYGRCWFASDSSLKNCDSVCGEHEYLDGTDFQCKMPNWSRVPRNVTEYGCTLHETLGFTCDDCKTIPFLISKSPSYKIATSTCYCYEGELFPISWCGGTNPFEKRICACV